MSIGWCYFKLCCLRTYTRSIPKFPRNCSVQKHALPFFTVLQLETLSCAAADILQLFGNMGNMRAVRKFRGITTQAIVITGVAAILFLFVIVLFVYECYTPECRLAADYVKEHITEDIDPCQDFYGYVCNTWAHRRASTLSFLEDVKGTKGNYTGVVFPISDSFWSN
ncbi:hypothetical protein HPB48_026286 [Haemaphysalis longicornis]|uniref:Uncharacterized protein n=1 Tax=Haemaphysalis longicornis TaxID=44386 RepID=A0A9J6HC18_HAELO|nr:hypothetical protein HPB48_026286 [Haemaphysalis longicornis]